MTVLYRKKLIEVALPLKAINEASAREKSIRHGHPSTLHLWWARRPLAACRAVLFSSLVDDPDSDPVYRKPNGKVDEEAAGIKRAELFNLIEELVQWENSNNPRVINAARAEIARCVASRKIELGELTKDTIIYGESKGKRQSKKDADDGSTAGDILLMKSRPEVVNAFLAEYAPPVLDPFCGGGSIPLEAQWLGLRAYGSDLNPVPVLITKALIEIPPKFAGQPPVNPEWQAKSKEAKAATSWQGAQGLAEDVRYYGQWMRNEAEKRIGHLYPKVKITKEMAKDRPDLADCVGQELTVIAWLRGRTVKSSSPIYRDASVPLVRSFWLGRKKGNYAWAEPIVDKQCKSITYRVRTGEPPATIRKLIDNGTKLSRGCKFRCLYSDDPIPEEHIKSQGMEGEIGECLLGIVLDGPKGRVYVSPNVLTEPNVQLSSIPDLSSISVDIANDKRAIWCLLYGLTSFEKLFLPRQLMAQTTFSDLVIKAHEHAQLQAADCGFTNAIEYANAVATYLAFTVSRLANRGCTISFWDQVSQKVQQAFARQGIPMTWDFCEANPFSESSGNWTGQLEFPIKCILASSTDTAGHAEQLDATVAISRLASPIISTDPPYYDNIGYADLSDFFYVWLRRSLKSVYPSLFATALTPKSQELIASGYRHDGDKDKARVFFESGLGSAFLNMHTAQVSDLPLTVYYAFKQSETEDTDEDALSDTMQTASTGWETMLSALIHSGFSITGTWPVRTELIGNLKKNISALASSIVLVCRSRHSDARLATRKEFVTALRQELPVALKNLQHGNIAPVDMAQSAIGPGMAVFSRYSKVIESDGTSMPVRAALGIINQVLDEVLAEQEGDFDADTRWALAWFEQHGMGEGPFGVAETLSKAKNTAVNGLVEAGVIKAKSGKVQLLKRTELPTDWNPATDQRLTVWETTQHLIRILETQGEGAAATLLHQLGGIGETARELAYRLYSICERKKWADEALAYNSLVIAWPELSKLAIASRYKQAQTLRQNELFN